MYPPERRARGISYVLSGSVVGALFGPFVFSPLFAGKGLEPSELVAPWITAGVLMLIGLSIVVFVRPDPKKIAERLGTAPAPRARRRRCGRFFGVRASRRRCLPPWPRSPSWSWS